MSDTNYGRTREGMEPVDRWWRPMIQGLVVCWKLIGDAVRTLRQLRGFGILP